MSGQELGLLAAAFAILGAVLFGVSTWLRARK